MYKNNARNENKTHDSSDFVLFFQKKKRAIEMKIVISATKETFKAQAALKFNTSNI